MSAIDQPLLTHLLGGLLDLAEVALDGVGCCALTEELSNAAVVDLIDLLLDLECWLWDGEYEAEVKAETYLCIALVDGGEEASEQTLVVVWVFPIDGHCDCC